jgi:hypothetical protein
MAPIAQQDLEDLRHLLQAITPGEFEKMAAGLIGGLLDVGVTVAKSGFQHGGDAGTAGKQGRRLRIETKRYADTTALNERELLGELEQACQRDDALELWVLAATTEVKEQLETSLFASGLKQGVPVLVVDWKQDAGIPILAALCASDPDLVEQYAGKQAGDLARKISPEAAGSIDRLRRDLAEWRPGYEEVAASAREWIAALWASPARSVAALGQDAAGGADPAFIERASIIRGLDDWWSSSPSAPAVAVGEEGMGKTWVSVGWLAANSTRLPITLLVPSGALPSAKAVTASDVVGLLARRLHEITGVRDVAFWTARITRLLRRPQDEGPVFLLFLDGMNQAPDAPWVSLHQQLQAPPFEDRVRILATTRPMFLEARLRHMSGLIVPPRVIPVGPYDDAPGGEFDIMLEARGLARGELRDELIPLARVPRLFDLVVRLKDRFRDAEKVTIHALLWEYGRDTLGARGGRSFTEQEWREWLADIARKMRESGSAKFTQSEMERSAARPTLAPAEVLARLSDIVDSHVSKTDATGRVVIDPAVAAHALGAAVLAHLEEVAGGGGDVHAELDQWLGPISGFTERGEILRAAVAILSATGVADPAVANEVVTAWIATQNLPEVHRRDVRALALQIPGPLLAAVENITSSALAGARDVAVEAMRSIPRTDEGVRSLVLEATTRWMSVISRGVEEGALKSDDQEKSRGKRMMDRIGIDEDGTRTILGRSVKLVGSADGAAFTQVPALLDGYPLAPFIDVFELAALHFAVRGRLDAWNSFKWLALMNEVDPDEMIHGLRQRAEDVLGRPVETGVEPLLRQRVAALLLWLVADPADDERAGELEPGLDRWHDYDRDYEADPSRSMFQLERRHAEQVLADHLLAPGARARRVAAYWWDPLLQVPPEVAAEIEKVGNAFEFSGSGHGRWTTAEDLDLEWLGPALARCSPAALARLARRRIAALADQEEVPPALGNDAQDALLVGDEQALSALRTARSKLPSNTDADGDRQLLLQPELIELDPEAQVEAIVQSGLVHLFTNVYPILKPLGGEAVDRLIERHGQGSAETVQMLATLLSVMAQDVSDAAAAWLEGLAFGSDDRSSGPAFRALARRRAAWFGSRLMARGWAWNAAPNENLAHYGSLALIAGTTSVPFEAVAPRVAPWLLGHAARERGSAPAEVRLAAEIFEQLVTRSDLQVPDPGSQLSIDHSSPNREPFVISVTPGLVPAGSDPVEEVNALLNQDRREEASKRAVAVAVERINASRAAGASLYLATLEPEDLEPILVHASDLVDRWLEGMRERTSEFKRRVRLAEGFFLALTEALIRLDPDRGTDLWSAVRASLHTKFIGVGGVDRMIQIMLRGWPSERVGEIASELVSPSVARNDETLLDLSIAAAAAGREDLLAEIARSDMASGVRWRVERATALDGFSPGEDAPAVFQDGRLTATEFRAARFGARHYRDHAARHWWNAYWHAADGELAFAYWTLLESCVDKRALEWIERRWPDRQANFPLLQRKRAFAASRRQYLKRAAGKAGKGLEKTLFGRDVVNDVFPFTPLTRGDRPDGSATDR